VHELVRSGHVANAERAALALTEAASRLSHRADPVPNEIWREAARHFDDSQLAAPVMSIGMINLWNRLNAATRQVGDAYPDQYAE
jgi:alkylhydroperoxidase family enzyme